MKCKVCGKKLQLRPSLRYEVVKAPTGIKALTDDTVIYECFDCQKCGCQNIVNIREGLPSEFKHVSPSDGVLDAEIIAGS
jgi:hypothetical protein